MSRSILFLLSIVFLIVSCSDRKGGETISKITFSSHNSENKLDVNIDGTLFTSFCWPQDALTPILYPVFTAEGTEISNGFSLSLAKTDKNNDSHQKGLWINNVNVNGFNFSENRLYGVRGINDGIIKHVRIDRLRSEKGEGVIISSEEWLDPAGQKLVTETSEYHFISNGSVRIIDRVITLLAEDTAVVFKEADKGMFGIRVAWKFVQSGNENINLPDFTELHPVLIDSLNLAEPENYLNSEGVTGTAIWGSRSRWVKLEGIIGNGKVTVVGIDHPKNPGYPAFWNAGGSGIFPANPQGWNYFTRGKKQYNFYIPEKKSLKLRYRILIYSGDQLSDNEINTYTTDFGSRYKKN